MVENMTPTTALQRLRLVLAANAAFSVVGGAIALLAGSWVSRDLGIDHVALTRILGAGLVLFGVAVALVSRASERRMVPESLLISLADAAWVVGTVVVVASGVLTTSGNVVASLIALAVADFGVSQLWFRSRSTTDSPQLHAAAA
jgi:uncharacterized membrane protein HdeD (DUF308 family)